MVGIKLLEVSQSVVSKRDDPNYLQLSGHIPSDMALEFKIACTKRRVSHSDGLEQAIALWLAQPDENEPAKSIKTNNHTAEARRR